MTTRRSALLAALLLASCKSPHSPVDPDEAQQACHGAAAVAATLDTIAGSLRTAVPAADDRLGVTGARPVLGAGGNTIVVDAGALKVPGAIDGELPSSVWDLGPDTMRTLTVARTGIDRYSMKVEQGDLDDLRKRCDQIGAATYVMIVHTTQHQLAYAARGDTFMPGGMAGTVHLYEVATGHHLGAFAVTAENSDSVRVLISEDKRGGQQLEEDLQNNYWAAIRARFHELGGAG